jgi:MarR family transcriptional regulator, organic hydroperoxide resistance regulator
MIDRMIKLSMIVPVSTTIETSVRTGRRDGDPSVDDVLEGLRPMMAYQRQAMMLAWQDRSLSKLNLHVLMLLDHHGPLPMSRLAALVDVSVSNMTGIVDRLEQHGLVERIRDDRDRRLVLVRATPTGASRCEEVEGMRQEHLRQLLGTLGGGERAVVLKAAQALARGVVRLETVRPTPDADA